MRKLSIFIVTLITIISFNLFYIPRAIAQINLTEINQNINEPSKLFEINCAGCHLNGGNIIRRGKNLKLKALQKNGYDTTESIATIITNGKNNMSAYGDRLSNQQINDLSNYVLNQAKNNWK
ncbi:c-type cytochrome [Cyanobacterium sp. IPPAS B-1200]|uniref:c-type cytochrome n=1 Tax=Cyanobacterium sp. IPPAS B-1200 TaxID=1562720 RepID=UPI0008526C78|nr:c-type cytochrome [Cyanobacterium sp. IPPAS B-1200]OEJ78215.1 cytochrome c class I [Cyanobacterium sp. IPPAS B-1200]